MAKGLKEGGVAAGGVGGEDVEELVLIEAGVRGDLVLEDELLDLGDMDGDLGHALQYLH